MKKALLVLSLFLLFGFSQARYPEGVCGYRGNGQAIPCSSMYYNVMFNTDYTVPTKTYYIDIESLLPDHTETCKTVLKDMEELTKNINKITLEYQDVKINCLRDGADCYKESAYINAIEILNEENTKLDFLISDCTKEQDKQVKEIQKIIDQGDKYYDDKDYSSALSKYRDARNQIKDMKFIEMNEAVEEMDKKISNAEKALDIKKTFENIAKLETKAYNYLQEKNLDKAYEYYMDVAKNEEDFPGYDYTSAKKAIKEIREIRKMNTEMEEAVQKSYMEQVERAKKELGDKAEIIDTFPSAPKMKDKNIREKMLKLCGLWKANKKDYYRAFGIYLEYLLTKDN